MRNINPVMPGPRQLYRLLFSFTSLLVCALVAAADDPPGAQQIDVAITVKAPDGSALQQAPILLLSKANVRFALTDESGVADFSILKVDDEDYLVTALTMGFGLPVIPVEDRSFAIDRYHELRDSFAFKRLYYVPVSGNGPFTLTIQAAEAVKLSGRLVDPDGTPAEGGVGAEYTLAHDVVWPDDNGVFTLGGIAKGQDAVLWYYGGDSSQWHRMALPGMLLQADIDRGDIVLSNTPLNASIKITSTNYEKMFLKDKRDLAQDVTLIERSTQDVFVYDVVRSTGKIQQRLPSGVPPEELQVTAGEYFVVPGNLLDLPRRAAYAALLAGRAQELEDAGVPLIDIRPGENDPVTIDATVAVEAIMQVGGDLVQE